MSSHDGDNGKEGEKKIKRRRIGRACDMCRLKKIRCDGPQGPGQRCSNCATYDDECTFVQDPPKRQSRPRGYVHHLEARVAAMEQLLAKLCPASDLSREIDALLEDDSLQLGGSDFDASDLSGDEAEDEDGEVLVGNIGRANSKKNRDTFTYAIPPAFSPSESLLPQNTLTRSPTATGFSSPSMDSSPQPVTPYISRSSPSEKPSGEEELESSDDELRARNSLGKYSWDPHNVASQRYFGKSSNVMILKKAIEMKYAYASDIRPKSKDPDEGLNQEELVLREKVRSFDVRLRSGLHSYFDPSKQYIPPGPCLCPRECSVHPWTSAAFRSQQPVFTFPEPDLLYALVSLYFSYYNPFTPLFHRPLFLAALVDGLHLRSADFGGVVLLVCALGARFSDDPRVLLNEDDDEGGAIAKWVDETSGDDQDEDNEYENKPEAQGQGRHTYGWHSAGWKWFRQVTLGCRALIAPATVYDLQIACLASIYFRGSSAPEASRTMTGLGLRLALDIGAHRRKIYDNIPNEEQELLKRAFWVLVWLEYTLSPILGRPCGIQYEDFDVDFPAECDDEYWITADPALAFKQPPGKPSLIAYFNSALRLNQINAFALRTIYSTNKSKAILGFVGQQWEQRIVAELDSALNAWLDTVPEHLRWDPLNPNPDFFHQSASLYALYYSLQITIHRPFIPSPRKPSRTSYPSLAICTNAARSCVHVVEAVYKRSGVMPAMHVNTSPLFMAGIVLMLNMWGSSCPATKHTMKEMEDIITLMEMLKVAEPRWHTAGRIWDMLYELAMVGELPLPSRDPPPPYQIPRKSYDVQVRPVWPASSSAGTSRSASRGKGSDHAGRSSSVSAATMRNADVESGSLPVRSAELGRLPLHPMFDTDPSPSWNQYDMSPSVFNPPTTIPSASPVQQEPSTAKPVLDSIFTAGRTQRSASLPHLHAPKPISPVTASFPSSFFPSPMPDIPPQSRPQATVPQDSTSPLQFQIPNGPSSNISDFNDDTLTMWSHAPAGFEWDDWGNYITNFNASAEGTATSESTFTCTPDVIPSNEIAPNQVFTFYDSPL